MFISDLQVITHTRRPKEKGRLYGSSSRLPMLLVLASKKWTFPQYIDALWHLHLCTLSGSLLIRPFKEAMDISQDDVMFVLFTLA